jgi:hypothetical protein
LRRTGGGNLLRSEGYAHAPIFVASSQIDVKQLVLQTIFLAVLLAVIVNLEPRRNWKRTTSTKFARAKIIDHRGFDPISDALPFCRLWHAARSLKFNE